MYTIKRHFYLSNNTFVIGTLSTDNKFYDATALPLKFGTKEQASKHCQDIGVLSPWSFIEGPQGEIHSPRSVLKLPY